MNEMYAYHWGNVAAFVGAARPNLSEKQCKAVSMQIAAYIDGLMLFTGRGAKRGFCRQEFHDMVVASVLRLISIDGPTDSQTMPQNPAHPDLSNSYEHERSQPTLEVAKDINISNVGHTKRC
jgi:hypothetical protein